MGRYRKVDPRIWNDAKFRTLDDQGKLVFFFLLTHPHMTAIGAMRASLPGLAAEIGWGIEAFRKAFNEASSKGMAEHDEKASFIWLPNFLKYNPPESPNVVKAWVHSLELLPECDMLNRVVTASVGYAKAMSKGFVEALPEAFAKTMPIQEQEQEQEQEEESDESCDSPSQLSGELKKPVNGHPIEFKTFIQRCKDTGDKQISTYKPVWAYAEKVGIPNDFIVLAWDQFSEKYGENGTDSAKRYKDWRITFRKSVEGNWFGLWYMNDAGKIELTSKGRMAMEAHK